LTYIDTYRDWLQWIDQDSKKELLAIKNSKEIEDRFYKNLEFGTGGMRGIMGVGSNRINKYVIRKATKGLADYLKKEQANAFEKGVVIAYDSRNNSSEFALEAAHVLCSAGIPVKLFKELEPTPVLSFAVKYVNAIAGIVITASHNPKEYNGYKVYDKYGDQIVPRIANQLVKYVNAITDISSIDASGNDFLLSYLGEEIVDAFVEAVFKQSVLKGAPSNLKIVYTPLHGTGNKPVRKILKKAGFSNLTIVAEQENPDGNFSTVLSPNPEDHHALALGLNLGKKIEADLVIGTDPDSDRIGVAISGNKDEFEFLTGNQIGALLVDFVLKMHKADLTSTSTLIKTVVTGDLGAEIARRQGVQVVETLTGFKYIGEKITQYRNDTNHDFVMGYEESYGYLVGTHAQDKDAVVAAMLICEMASYYKIQGKTLLDVLTALYQKYGYYYDMLDSYTLQGIKGFQKIQDIMMKLQKGCFKFSDEEVRECQNFNDEIMGLPKTNMMKFILRDGSWIAVRPSGTEPKIKIYYSIKDINQQKAQQRVKMYKKGFENTFDL
jgi:phosphoglucomutase